MIQSSVKANAVDTTINSKDYAEKTAAVFLDFPNLNMAAADLGKPFRVDLILKGLEQQYRVVAKLVYLYNGYRYRREAEQLWTLGFDVVSCMSKNSDVVMGLDIGDIVAKVRPQFVIMGTHDGDFREAADRLTRSGVQVLFSVYPRSHSLSWLIRSQRLIDIDNLCNSVSE